ncbi:hypothetical protein [Algicola sagamiensis]|uniref:hypothetical protein n=1 Tax=Algicola sagamiensis TaxID=163869 RepID=UPI0003654B9A|nr:hypothetical protein [Algicola sagamiensis]
MAFSLDILTKDILDQQASKRKITSLAKTMDVNVNTLRDMRKGKLLTLKRAQQIIESEYKIVLVPKDN